MICGLLDVRIIVERLTLRTESVSRAVMSPPVHLHHRLKSSLLSLDGSVPWGVTSSYFLDNTTGQVGQLPTSRDLESRRAILSLPFRARLCRKRLIRAYEP